MVHQRGNNSIGRITTNGTVTTYTGTGIASPQGITTGPDGALWFTNYTGNSAGRITTTGTVTNYPDPLQTLGPAGIALGPERRSGSVGRCGSATTMASAARLGHSDWPDHYPPAR